MSVPARISPARLALAARKLRGEREDLGLLASDPIAVIGMACRFPGQGDSPEAYWKALAEGRNGVVEMPESRWPERAGLDPAQRLGGYLEAIDGFDAEYFGIAPREAGQIDPQQRLLLEVVWEALWDAGVETARLAGTAAGVFVSLYNNDYARMQFSDRSALGAYAGIGTAHSIAAGRVSYLLNVRGPSICVDTACSSSLVATHLAVESLRSGESSLAIVGASSLKVLPDEVVVFSKWGMLARDGQCKTFDAAADGFAAGEGAGTVILKRLSDALQDGDRVRAVIRGTAVNHDGRSTVLTAPNGLAQQAVMRAALDGARIDPAEVGYIETHGTGTSLGDPIEVEALQAVYGSGEPLPCVLGAVKTNLGHLEAAAGVAGLIKTVLCLENEAIPKNLHFRKLNPEIALEGSRLVIPTETVAWPRGARARVAGVSSFGLGGTNAHVIVEEAPLMPAGRARAPLARRAWKRERCWLPEATRMPVRAVEGSVHPLLGREVRSGFVEGRVFEAEIGTDTVSYLRDHGLGDRPLLPFAAFLEMAQAAGRQSRGEGPFVIAEFTVVEPLFLEKTRVVQTLVSDTQIAIASEGVDGWVKHAQGSLRRVDDAPATVNLAAVRARCSQAVESSEVYRRLEATGLRYGPAFRGLVSIARGAGESLAEIRLPRELQGEAAGCALHPVLLDGCLQAVMAALPEMGDHLLLPLAVEEARVLRSGASEAWAHVVVRAAGELVEADITVMDAAGAAIAVLRGFQAKRTNAAAVDGARPKEAAMYEIAWRATPLPEDSGTVGGARRWLLVEGTPGSSAGLAARLTHAGGVAQLASLAEAGRRLRTGDWTDVLLCLRAGDRREDGAGGEQPAVEFVLEFVTSLRGKQAVPRLWVVAPGAAAAVAGEAICLAHAPLVGLLRTLGCEHPATKPALIDAVVSVEEDAIVRELLASGADPRVAMRRGARYAARMAAAAPVGQRVERLVSDSPGVLDALRWEKADRPEPGSGEIEIEVRANGLNFRDVLNALGVFDVERPRFGAECAGIVTRVGAGVTSFRVGDRVLAFAPGSLQSYAVVPEAYAAPLPRGLSLAQAATIPVAFLTAHYGLVRLAQLRRGQRVLIHAAAGGLGLAAMQSAQRAGAEIYATAGSEWKREMLRGMGVREVFDSRSASFRESVLQATGGRGVDVVLNSLTGELIPAGLACVAPNGCFLEVGKRGIWSAEAVRQVRPELRYFAFDLGEVAREDPELMRAMLGELMPEFAAGRLEPLRTTVFPAEEAAAAFRTMAQAGHVGKIVLSRRAEGEPQNLASVVAGGTVLVTGGLGALGGAVATWLTEQGAKRVVLAGRTADAERLAQLQAAGAEVIFEPMDVTNPTAVEAVLGRIRASGVPLKAVFHAAGVTQDRVLDGESWESYRQATAAKTAGALNLHRLTESDPAEMMVFFSSAAGVLGAPGQGSYAAGNTFLDALAHERTAQGRATLSVDWGGWAEAGMAARLGSGHAARLERQGMGLMEPAAALAALEKAIAERRTQVAVLEVDWERFLQERAATDEAFFAELRRREPKKDEPAATVSIREVLLDAPAEERKALLAAHVRECARHALSLHPGAAVQEDVPLQEIGLDSLMAIDMKNELAQSLDLSLSAGLLFNYPTVGQLTEYLLGQWPAGEATPATGDGDDGAALATMSEEEAERLLLEELERAGSEATHA
jgi:acyl transferase domain-containing protein/acyl carrier protein